MTTLITAAKETSCAVVRFCYHSYDYRPNWTPLSPITITNQTSEMSQDKTQHMVHADRRPFFKGLFKDQYLFVKVLFSTQLDIPVCKKFRKYEMFSIEMCNTNIHFIHEIKSQKSGK